MVYVTVLGINRPYHHNVLNHPDSRQNIINSPRFSITCPFLRVQVEVSPKPENSKYTSYPSRCLCPGNTSYKQSVPMAKPNRLNSTPKNVLCF